MAKEGSSHKKYEDDNYKLSMPLQHDSAIQKGIDKNFKRSLNFDHSQNQYSVILGNPDVKIPQE
jgi:hypothetical protein